MSEPAAASSPRPALLWGLTALITILLAMTALEIAARIMFPAPLPWRMPQNRFDASPSLGFRFRPNQAAFTADKPFRTNSFGLRGPERPLAKAAGVRRIVVLGDSIGMGYGVREEDDFASVLEKSLGTGVEVINGAVAAYSTDQEVRWFLDQGRYFQPNDVVIELYWNDVASKAEVGVTPDGDLMDQRAAADARGAMDSAWGYWIRNLFKQSRALYIVSFKLRQMQGAEKPDPTRVKQMAVLEGQDNAEVTRGWQEIERQLITLRDACASINASLLVVVPPMPQQLAASFPKVRYQTVVAEICARQQLKCLDLLPVFAKAYQGHESLFIAYDGDHPNEAGHALMAEAIRGAITAPAAR